MTASGLNDAQIMRLHRELVAPVIVHQILGGHDVLDEMAGYALDTMIAECPPDSALLCVALCAAHIAEHRLLSDSSSSEVPNGPAAILGFEAARVVHELGPWWLAHIDGKLGPDDQAPVLDLLDRMPEDFESLADLLGVVRASVVETSDMAALCDILIDNAQAFVESLEQQAEEKRILERRQLLNNLQVSDNIITFPRPYRGPGVRVNGA